MDSTTIAPSPRVIRVSDVNRAMSTVRRELAAVQAAVDRRDTRAARDAAERVQHAGFDLKDLFSPQL
jgi:hypothetical protein